MSTYGVTLILLIFAKSKGREQRVRAVFRMLEVLDNCTLQQRYPQSQ